MSASDPSDYFRFCPGEEAIKLSNAICRGRRRSSFPKCKGCQFNDDEKAVAARATARTAGAPDAKRAGAVVAAKVEHLVPAERRDLAPLFRTTDIRGAYPHALSTDAAWRIGYSTAQFLRSKLKGFERVAPQSRSLVTGCDARSESAAIHTAMTQGVRAAGITVLDVGAVDTPQLYFAVRHLDVCGGIMTTGGRSAGRFSGFKICGAGGREVATSTGLIDIRDIAGRVPSHETGTLAGRREIDLTEAYRDFVLSFGPSELTRLMTVVVDGSDGVAGRWVRETLGVMERLTLIIVDDDRAEPESRAGDPFDAARLKALGERVVQENANWGVCFDGDADACAFVDDRGEAVRPEMAALVLGRAMLERAGAGAVVIDDAFAPPVREALAKAGAVLRRERGESSHIRRAMVETAAMFGASASGQYYFRQTGLSESALAATAQMVRALCESERKLSELVAISLK